MGFRLLATVAALMIGMNAAAQAQDPGTIYVVTYVDVQPPAKAKAAALIAAFRDASRKDEGNLRAEAVERASRPGQFAVLTAWKDQKALDAHAASAHAKAFRDGIQPLRASPLDDRIHTGLSIGNAEPARAGRAVYVVTHVDVVPPRKDDAVGLLKALGEASRKEDGNLRYEVVQQTNRPNHFTVVEMWSGQEAFEAHGMAAHVRDFRDKIAPMSGALYDERLFRELN